MSTLNERQNEQAAIDKLAAQNQIYADAKTRLGIYLILSIPVIMLLNLVVKPMFLHDWFGLGKTFEKFNKQKKVDGCKNSRRF
jgi:hypothetical protein